ncbi:hypothetical protein [Pedobacter sp. KLB.chiD]|uniref:hypothetical protein n=1 Tax=Pedobacter sp. KLB.chiD TaxID=3387402 RepID=UPI00399A60A9
METITDSTLVDWLYNRFVEAVRNDDYRKIFIYEDVLHQINNLLPSGRKYTAMKKRAKAHLKEILKASKGGALKKLHYTGAEFTADFNRIIEAYEKELHNTDFDEETINYLLNIKKETYGND